MSVNLTPFFKHPLFPTGLALLLCIKVYLLDIYTSLGESANLLYALIIWFSSQWNNKNLLINTIMFSNVFIILAFATTSTGDIYTNDLIKRLMHLILVNFLGYFLIKKITENSDLLSPNNLIENAQDAVVVLNLNARIVHVNHAAELLFGSKRNQMRNQSVDCFFPDGQEMQLLDAIDSLKDKRPIDHFQSQIRREDEKLTNVSISISPIHNAQDELWGLFAVIRDISLQKQFEDSIQKSESRLRLILNSALDGVVIINEYGYVTEWNPKAEKIFGYQRSEVLGQPMEQFIVPTKYRDKHIQGMHYFRQHREGKLLNRRIELEAIGKNKAEFPVELTIIPIASGNNFEFCAFVRDITNRKKAEKDQAYLSAIVETTDAAIIGRSMDGKVISWNKGAENLYGYTAEEIINMPVHKTIPEDRLYEYDSMLAQIKDGELIKHFETVRRRKSGELIDVSLTVSPIKSPKNKIMGISIIARDITSRKTIERILVKTNQALAASNKELQEFAFIASHDLKEPIRKIVSFGKLLSSNDYGELNDKGLSFLNYILDAADRMQELLNSLLSYSRITSRTDPFEPVDLNKILNAVISDLGLVIKESCAEFEIQELPTIDADPVQIRQLFQNLIENSIKYRNEDNSKVLIEISTKPGKDNKTCYIYVKDNGIGFESKYKEQIFEVFRRLHTRKQYQGNGMGLSICRKIAERHKGKIDCESTPGIGTTFIIELPLKKPSEFV